jgi:hypothetical protein
MVKSRSAPQALPSLTHKAHAPPQHSKSRILEFSHAGVNQGEDAAGPPLRIGAGGPSLHQKLQKKKLGGHGPPSRGSWIGHVQQRAPHLAKDTPLQDEGLLEAHSMKADQGDRGINEPWIKALHGKKTKETVMD